MKGKEIGNFDICLKWIMGFFSPKQELELAEFTMHKTSEIMSNVSMKALNYSNLTLVTKVSLYPQFLKITSKLFINLSILDVTHAIRLFLVSRHTRSLCMTKSDSKDQKIQLVSKNRKK